MQSTRQDFQALLEKKRDDVAFDRRRELRVLSQASVPVEALTGTKEWDFFNSLIQDKIEELSRMIDALADSIPLDPSFSYEDLISQKAEMIRLRTQRDALEEVRNLPKQIIEKGESAQLVLQRIEED